MQWRIAKQLSGWCHSKKNYQSILTSWSLGREESKNKILLHRSHSLLAKKYIASTTCVLKARILIFKVCVVLALWFFYTVGYHNDRPVWKTNFRQIAKKKLMTHK